MSDELFEVAFSGQISDGADLQEVKSRIGKIFKADGARLEQLFSGRRIVIKKNVDRLTAHKYKDALRSAGAECEVQSMSASVADPAATAPQASSPEPANPADGGAQAVRTAQSPAPETASATPADVAPPPQTDPLGITGDQIGELVATIAPPGSELQSEIKKVPAPQFDLSAFDLAPVGSTLGDAKKAPDPPPPDTSGLSMADS